MTIATLVSLWEINVAMMTISGGMLGAGKGLTVQTNSLVEMVVGGVAGALCGATAGTFAPVIIPGLISIGIGLKIRKYNR